MMSSGRQTQTEITQTDATLAIIVVVVRLRPYRIGYLSVADASTAGNCQNGSYFVTRDPFHALTI